MNIKTLFLENKALFSLVLVFVLGLGILGYLTWDSWETYGLATANYDSKASELDRLAHKEIFPSASNLKKLTQTLDQDQTNLDKLRKALAAYRVQSFGDFEKTRPQDQPQYLQDKLRDQVTEIKSSTATSGTTLPANFYLGLDEFENHLPQPDQLLLISKQLTVLDWLGKTLAALKGATIADFSLVPVETSKPSPTPPQQVPLAKNAAPIAAPADPFESLGTVRVTLRCAQNEFRNLINTLSSSPYFLVIEDIKVQNTAGEAPLKEASPSTVQPPADGLSAPVQRLPIIVGREALNVYLRLKMINFPAVQNSQSPSK